MVRVKKKMNLRQNKFGCAKKLMVKLINNLFERRPSFNFFSSSFFSNDKYKITEDTIKISSFKVESKN